MEIDMKQAEIREIKKLIKKNQEIHRITERWRSEAVFIFCKIHGITLETYTPYEYTMRITNAPPVNDMITEYVTAINQYRLQVRTDLHNRCTGLEQDVSWITGEFSQIEMDLFHALVD
jgi:diketogulonate reductase-like aldo/keto reductase